MSYLFFDHQNSGRSLYINGRGFSDPHLMDRLPVTYIKQGITEQQKLYLEQVRDNPSVGLLFIIPHASIFLLNTSSLPLELTITKLPDSHKNLPDVFGDPAKRGIVVWAKKDTREITIIDNEAIHNLTQPSHVYTREDISITLF